MTRLVLFAACIASFAISCASGAPELCTPASATAVENCVADALMKCMPDCDDAFAAEQLAIDASRCSSLCVRPTP